ncbi:MAG: cation:dicarboxylase symporter family transporter [Eggerthellaceae bacterium]|nr:cation:dicarboxylase symporter family transporter [Eggerthellaceae bacterium]
MFFKAQSKTFELSPTNIDGASDWFVEIQEKAGIEKQDRLRARLLLEEALLNLQEHFGKQQEVTAFFEKRRQRFRLRLVTHGDRFNPLKSSQEEADAYTQSLFSVIDMRAQYSYSMGTNIVRIPLPRRTSNPAIKIIIAIVAGLIIGLLGNLLIPDAAQEVITGTVIEPLGNAWVRLLQLISGPVIFFTALAAALGTKRISDYGGSRFTSVARYFAVGAIMVVFAMIASIPFLAGGITISDADQSVISSSLDTVLQIIPNNVLEPFNSANTPQLLLVAIFTGYALASMDDRVADVKSLMQQLNLVGLTIARRICDLVPYFVGLLLCLRIWTHKTELLSAIWEPLVASVVLSLIAFAGYLCFIGIRLRVSPVLLARKLKGPFLKTLRQGVIDFGAVDELAGRCHDDLGIDREFAKAALPQGLILFMPTSGIGIWMFVIFAAQVQQLPIDQIWILAAAALAVVLAVATPPVTGANLLTFVVAFSFLGISTDFILDAMVFDVLFNALCMAVDQAILQVETALQAKRLGFLDEDRLRAPLESADR